MRHHYYYNKDLHNFYTNNKLFLKQLHQNFVIKTIKLVVLTNFDFILTDSHLKCIIISYQNDTIIQHIILYIQHLSLFEIQHLCIKRFDKIKITLI